MPLPRGAEVSLTPKEFRLLDFFARNSGRALTRDKILSGVWGDDLIVTDRSVDRCINTLRNKIEPDPEHPRFIKTIRDVGYRFEPEHDSGDGSGSSSAMSRASVLKIETKAAARRK